MIIKARFLLLPRPWEGVSALASEQVNGNAGVAFILQANSHDEQDTQMSQAEGCSVSADSMHTAALTGVGSKSSGSSTNGRL